MKKIILSLLLMFLFTMGAQSQFRFGAKAGISTISASQDKLQDYIDENTIGFYVGPTAEFIFNERWGIDASILYTEKGVKFKNDKTRRHGYIEVPINAKYIYPINKTIKVYGSAGPYVSFKIAGSDSFTLMQNDVKGEWDTKNFGIGLNVNGGFELFNMLQIGVSYGMGFADNYKSSNGQYSIKDRVWSLSATAYF